MGIDMGFDMVPRLTSQISHWEDISKWVAFLDDIKKTYFDDPRVEMKVNHILFQVGERPTLPFEGSKFLRFSSKVSMDPRTEKISALSSSAPSYILVLVLSFGTSTLINKAITLGTRSTNQSAHTSR